MQTKQTVKLQELQRLKGELRTLNRLIGSGAGGPEQIQAWKLKKRLAQHKLNELGYIERR